MRFLVGCGALKRSDVPFGWLLPDAPAPAPVTVTHRVVARSLQFEFVQDYRGGETIRRAGTPIAHDAGEPVLTPYDDCVLVMPSVRQLRPGVTTVRLGRRHDPLTLRPHEETPMRTDRRLILAASAAALLAACTTAPPKPSLAEVGIYAAGPGSAFLPYAQGLAAYLSASGLKAQALESKGSIENLGRVDAEPQRLGTAFLGT
eukprot:gene10228-12976_t